MNELGLELLKSFERLRLEAYRDLRGILTIGWGDTWHVTEGEVITAEEAEWRLRKALSGFESHLDHLLSVSLSQDQHSALLCLVYNIGVGPRGFGESELRRLINGGEVTGDQVRAAWLEWHYAEHLPIKGLEDRRLAEWALFTSDYETVRKMLDSRKAPGQADLNHEEKV